MVLGVGFGIGAYQLAQNQGFSDAWNARITSMHCAATAPRHGFFDIQRTNKNGVFSVLKDGPCDIEQILDVDVLLLDQAFLAKCKSAVLTFLFYTRSGVIWLLETSVAFPHDYTGAAVSVSRNCKKGD
jgi:hypothetical protein